MDQGANARYCLLHGIGLGEVSSQDLESLLALQTGVVHIGEVEYPYGVALVVKSLSYAPTHATCTPSYEDRPFT